MTKENSNLLNIPVIITVELGRVKVPIQQLLNMSNGSIVELDKKINEPLLFYVNGKLFGSCTIVVLNENKIGMKIVEIFEH